MLQRGLPGFVVVVVVFCDTDKMSEDRFSHQCRLGLLPGGVASLICGFRRVSGQSLLYAALVLWTAPDIAVVRMLRDDLILSVHC